MLKKLFNECTFTLTLTPVDPILIKSGYATVMGADMTPVVTQRNGQTQVFLPGSSLKGVFRSHAERIVRTIKDGIVCIPYLDKKDTNNYPDVFCGHKFRHRSQKPIVYLLEKDFKDFLAQFPEAEEVLKSSVIQDTDKIWIKLNKHLESQLAPKAVAELNKHSKLSNEFAYSESCPACRLFGSTDFIGRFAISDAYLTNPEDQQIERRDGVGIDRFTGGAAHGAKFELEVVTSGAFQTKVHLRNFEIWQLGMVAAVLKDFQDELIRIGSGKSRGLGKVKGAVTDFTLAFLPVTLRETIPEREVWGLGKFLQTAEYGTFGDDDVLTVTEPLPRKEDGLRLKLPLDDANREAVLGKAIEAFADTMADWTVPRTMTQAYLKSKE